MAHWGPQLITARGGSRVILHIKARIGRVLGRMGPVGDGLLLPQTLCEAEEEDQ